MMQINEMFSLMCVAKRKHKSEKAARKTKRKGGVFCKIALKTLIFYEKAKIIRKIGHP